MDGMVDVFLFFAFLIGLVVLVTVGVALTAVVRFGLNAQRRAVDAASTLQLRTAARPGAAGRDVARLRLRLRESVQHSRTVIASPIVTAGAAQAEWWNDAADQLLSSAARLDARLALIEREPEPGIREQILATLGPRVEQVIADAAAMRNAAYALTVELEHPGAGERQRDLRDRIDGLLLAIRELARPA